MSRGGGARKSSSLAAWALAAILFAAVAVVARAQTPAIGLELRQKRDTPPPGVSPLIDRKSPSPPIAGFDKALIRRFRFHGATLIPPEELAAEVESFTGRELTAEDLRLAATAIARRYLRMGSMARVKIAAVSVAERIADIEIQEMRVDEMHIELRSEQRITEEHVERFITADVKKGDPVPLAKLEDGVALLNGQPGVAAAIALDPGTTLNDVKVSVRVEDRPVVSGRAVIDNHGLREIGQEQLGLTLHASNAMGYLERFSIDLEKSAGAELVSPAFSIALPVAGMRAGLEATLVTYQAKRAGAALALKGDFDYWKAYLHQPWIRAPGLGLNLDYALLQTRYRDDSLFGELRKRRVAGASIRLAGLSRNESTASSFRLELERGSVDLSCNAADLAADAISAKIDGSYWRLNWRIGHERALGAGTLSLRASGQWAGRNLDATRQFALGGIGQVRAYPTAEAIGDGGWIASAQWNLPLTADLGGRLYLDTGGIQRNAKPWTNQRNRYELSGVGAGLSWQLPEGFRFDADVAAQAGGNAGRNADGTESDGRRNRSRLWLALSRDF